MEERAIPVLQGSTEGHGPHAFVFAGLPGRALTPAEAKRARYVQNLKENLLRFKEAVSSLERLAVVCELSPDKVDALRRAKDDALADLDKRFEEKLRAYDARIKGGAS